MKKLFAVLLLILVSLVLTGCVTTYSAQRTDPDTGVVTTIDVRSWREFSGGIKIKYSRATGAFELEAGEVTSGSEAEAMRDVVLGILPLIQPIAGG